MEAAEDPRRRRSIRLHFRRSTHKALYALGWRSKSAQTSGEIRTRALLILAHKRSVINTSHEGCGESAHAQERVAVFIPSVQNNGLHL